MQTMRSLRGVELLQGETFTLAASAARTADDNGTAVYFGGERTRFYLLLTFTNKATDAGDTCDVYVDVSHDNSTWVNAVHFTQVAGNAADASKEWAVLDSAAPGTSTINVTSDAASGVVRPAVIGAYLRARWAIVDSGNANQTFTFSLTGYAR